MLTISGLAFSDHSTLSDQKNPLQKSRSSPHVSTDTAAYSDKCSRTSSQTDRDRSGSNRQSETHPNGLMDPVSCHTAGASHQPIRHEVIGTPLNAPDRCPMGSLPQQVHYPRRQTDCDLRLEDHRGLRED